MKILLVGEYSGLHNTLKQGLQAQGHEVTLVAAGDGFKKFPADVNIGERWTNAWGMSLIRRAVAKITGFDIALWERGWHFSRFLKKMERFDLVQLINERPIKTTISTESRLIKKLLQKQPDLFVLCCGADYLSISYLLSKPLPYSILTPYFEQPDLRQTALRYMFGYVTPASKKWSDWLVQHSRGIIASDLDYWLALQNHPKFLGLIPNPVNLAQLPFKPLEVHGRIQIFLGINPLTRVTKGISHFEAALAIVEQKYADRIKITKSQGLPYADYMRAYDSAHIVLDQVYSQDQGYNALEAMARGKVVFTGAENVFIERYKLEKKSVAINAVPDARKMADALCELIESPERMAEISKNAREFIEREHDYVSIAKKYINTWESSLIGPRATAV